MTLRRINRLVALVLGLAIAAGAISAATAAAEPPANAAQIRDRVLSRIERGRLLRAPQISGGQTAPGGGPGYESVVISGQVRLFQRYTPNAVLVAGKPAPVVVVLHPDGGRADRTAATIGLNRLADSEGFVAVYAQAAGTRWGTGSDAASADVEFLTRLVDALIAQRIADSRRVYLLGVGPGGGMALRVACAGDPRYVAFAIVAGNVPTNGLEPCRTSPLRLVIVAGTSADDALTSGPAAQPGDPSSIVAQRLGCATPAAPTTAGRVTRTRWRGCRKGVSIELVRALERLPIDRAGPEVWGFFRRNGR